MHSALIRVFFPVEDWPYWMLLRGEGWVLVCLKNQCDKVSST